MNKAVFLDRDGVLIKEIGRYVFRPNEMIFCLGLQKFVSHLNQSGFKLIVITNQAGISRGLYTHEDVNNCHSLLQDRVDNKIDAFYYSPYHPTITRSLSRKPETLMLEKASARFKIDLSKSWFIGDSDSDIVAGKIMGIETIQLLNPLKTRSNLADWHVHSLEEALQLIK